MPDTCVAAFVPGPQTPGQDLDVGSCAILVVDDVAVNAKLLQAALGDAGFTNVAAMTDSSQVVSTIYRDPPDLLMLDIMMPGTSGLEILAAIRSDARFHQLPVLIMTAAEDRSLKRESLELGATDFLAKPVDVEELVPRVRNALVIKVHQDRLEHRIRERTRQLELMHQELICCLARAAEYRDNETGNHILRVGAYCGIIAGQLGLDSQWVKMLEQAATLHDLGKIAIPDSILLKPGKLTEDEFEFMQRHSAIGMRICRPMSVEENDTFLTHTTVGAEIARNCTSPLMRTAATIALTHHEHWDGTGYPLGLAGEDIPIEGRITAVADVFDALSSKRPYKSAFPLQKCLEVLEQERGKQFDPTVVDAFFARKDDIIAIQITYADIG